MVQNELPFEKKESIKAIVNPIIVSMSSCSELHIPEPENQMTKKVGFL